MSRRSSNTLFFFFAVVGAMFLFLGIMAIVRGGDDWWLYLIGSGVSFLYLLTPGARLNRYLGKP
jgi:hypothetical protein